MSKKHSRLRYSVGKLPGEPWMFIDERISSRAHKPVSASQRIAGSVPDDFSTSGVV